MNAIVKCVEEEYAPFWALPLRRREGWRWLPFYLRGPASGGPFTPLLTLVGVWRFARKPRKLADLPEEDYAGGVVVDSTPFLGSYGMGGPGFLGLRCRRRRGSFWIVFVLWGAAGWLTLDGKLLESGLLEDERKLYEKRGIVPIQMLHGGSVESINFSGDRMAMTIRKADVSHILELRRNGADVPPWRGTGKKKTLAESESLEDAIVVSRRARLWLES